MEKGNNINTCVHLVNSKDINSPNPFKLNMISYNKAELIVPRCKLCSAPITLNILKSFQESVEKDFEEWKKKAEKCLPEGQGNELKLLISQIQSDSPIQSPPDRSTSSSPGATKIYPRRLKMANNDLKIEKIIPFDLLNVELKEKIKIGDAFTSPMCYRKVYTSQDSFFRAFAFRYLEILVSLENKYLEIFCTNINNAKHIEHSPIGKVHITELRKHLENLRNKIDRTTKLEDKLKKFFNYWNSSPEFENSLFQILNLIACNFLKAHLKDKLYDTTFEKYLSLESDKLSSYEYINKYFLSINHVSKLKIILLRLAMKVPLKLFTKNGKIMDNSDFSQIFIKMEAEPLGSEQFCINLLCVDDQYYILYSFRDIKRNPELNFYDNNIDIISEEEIKNKGILQCPICNNEFDIDFYINAVFSVDSLFMNVGLDSIQLKWPRCFYPACKISFPYDFLKQIYGAEKVKERKQKVMEEFDNKIEFSNDFIAGDDYNKMKPKVVSRKIQDYPREDFQDKEDKKMKAQNPKVKQTTKNGLQSPEETKNEEDMGSSEISYIGKSSDFSNSKLNKKCHSRLVHLDSKKSQDGRVQDQNIKASVKINDFSHSSISPEREINPYNLKIECKTIKINSIDKEIENISSFSKRNSRVLSEINKSNSICCYCEKEDDCEKLLFLNCDCIFHCQCLKKYIVKRLNTNPESLITCRKHTQIMSSSIVVKLAPFSLLTAVSIRNIKKFHSDNGNSKQIIQTPACAGCFKILETASLCCKSGHKFCSSCSKSLESKKECPYANCLLPLFYVYRASIPL